MNTGAALGLPALSVAIMSISFFACSVTVFWMKRIFFNSSTLLMGTNGRSNCVFMLPLNTEYDNERNFCLYTILLMNDNLKPRYRHDRLEDAFLDHFVPSVQQGR